MEIFARGNNSMTSAISNGAEDILNKASSSAHAAVNSIAGAVDQAERTAKPAVDWLAEQGKSLNNTQKKLVAGTSGYISDNPLKSVGIAVLAGFLLGHINLRYARGGAS